MKVILCTNLGNLTADQAVTVALNNATVCDQHVMVNVETEATGGAIEASSGQSIVAADSNPVKVVTPRFLPRAKQGCKGVCVVDYADANSATVSELSKEFETYSYLTDPGTGDIIMWGTINYDQIDDDYDPVIGQAAKDTSVFAFWH